MTTHCEPNSFAKLIIKSGFSIAAEFTEILSAPTANLFSASSKFLIFHPTVIGINVTFDTFLIISKKIGVFL